MIGHVRVNKSSQTSVSCILWLRCAAVINDRECTAWKRLLSKLQDQLAAKRAERLEDEKNRRINRRCAIATGLYFDYLRTLVPVQWRYLPTPQHVVATRCSITPCFHRLLHMADEPQEQQWTDAAHALPGELSAHLLSHLERLADASLTPDDLPAGFVFAFTSEASDIATVDALHSQFRLLDIASTVSVHSQSNWTTGYDNLHAWDHMHVDGREPSLSSQGAYMIGAFAELLGKDMTLTTTELDSNYSDTWVRCMTCKDDPRQAYHIGWRSWVRSPAMLSKSNDTNLRS